MRALAAGTSAASGIGISARPAVRLAVIPLPVYVRAERVGAMSASGTQETVSPSAEGSGYGDAAEASGRGVGQPPMTHLRHAARGVRSSAYGTEGCGVR
jgi:hypothetical protein